MENKRQISNSDISTWTEYEKGMEIHHSTILPRLHYSRSLPIGDMEASWPECVKTSRKFVMMQGEI